MAAKNAVVNLLILSTFFSFLLYRRANKGETKPFSSHGSAARITLIITAGLTVMYLVWYALGLRGLEMEENILRYVSPLVTCLVIQIIAIIIALLLTFANKGKFAQIFLFVVTTVMAVIYFWYYGLVVMEKANLVLRYLFKRERFKNRCIL